MNEKFNEIFKRKIKFSARNSYKVRVMRQRATTTFLGTVFFFLFCPQNNCDRKQLKDLLVCCCLNSTELTFKSLMIIHTMNLFRHLSLFTFSFPTFKFPLCSSKAPILTEETIILEKTIIFHANLQCCISCIKGLKDLISKCEGKIYYICDI